MNLPDINDCHILAAAVRTSAGVIVTYNLKDFPEDTLSLYEIEAQHPDDFIAHLLDLNAGAVVAAAKAQHIVVVLKTHLTPFKSILLF